MSRTLELSLSPALYPFRTTVGKHLTVVIDILRFTTSVIAAFDYGVKSVIPVSSVNEALDYKNNGFLVAGELDGLRLPFADFGNSATDFNTPEIVGKTLAYTTTNGTVAMKMAAENGAVLAAAFTNLTAIAQWLNAGDENIVILCAGWKNLISIEDTLCAGALIAILSESGNFSSNCDSANMALEYWHKSEHNLRSVIAQTSHFQRLLRLGVDPLLDYTLMQGTSQAIPAFENGLLTNKSICA